MNRKFPVGSWVLRFYPPAAAQNKLGSPWVGPQQVVRQATGHTVGIQKGPDTPIIFIHVDERWTPGPSLWKLMETICPPMLVAQERPPTNDLETPSLNWFPVETVTEEDITQPELLSDSTEGCFSCVEWTHTKEQFQALDESFPFLPIGWVAEHNEDTFILGPGPPSSPRSHQTGNDD